MIIPITQEQIERYSLLILSAKLVKALENLVDSGRRSDHFLAMSMDMPGTDYENWVSALNDAQSLLQNIAKDEVYAGMEP